MGYRVNNKRGFTLLELMIVVIIIGILATMAIPRMLGASVKSKQSEAKLILKQIYTEQRAYRQQFDQYFLPAGPADKNNPTAFQPLEVSIMQTSRYVYTITSTDGGILNFNAQATIAAPGLDDDPAPDIWEIDHAGDLREVSNDAVI